jgi:hypothetical protein
MQLTVIKESAAAVERFAWLLHELPAWVARRRIRVRRIRTVRNCYAVEVPVGLGTGTHTFYAHTSAGDGAIYEVTPP